MTALSQQGIVCSTCGRTMEKGPYNKTVCCRDCVGLAGFNTVDWPEAKQGVFPRDSLVYELTHTQPKRIHT